MLPRFYADPALYDLIHADGTADEVWLLDLLAKRHGNGGRAALEPACGTGRYLEGLLRRGWRVHGYDIAPGMVAYARKRLAKWGDKARVERGDMTSFKPKRSYDLAFNLISTFRHLVADRDALAHLRATARALNPGGIYILGLHFARYGRDETVEEVWTTRRGGRAVTHVMLTLPPEPRDRLERVVNFVTVSKGRKAEVIESSYDLRSYDVQQLAELLRDSPFQVAAVYGCDGRIAEIDGPEQALWLVLRLKT